MGRSLLWITINKDNQLFYERKHFGIYCFFLFPYWFWIIHSGHLINILTNLNFPHSEFEAFRICIHIRVVHTDRANRLFCRPHRGFLFVEMRNTFSHFLANAITIFDAA